MGASRNHPPGLHEFFGCAPRGSERQRGALPLPPASAFLEQGAQTGSSRSVTRKFARRRHECEWADLTVDTLNDLWGTGSAKWAETSLPATHLPCTQGILEAVTELGAAPVDLTPERAFRKLLGGSAGYSDVRPDLGSFSLDLISWPEVGSGFCDITELLPLDGRIRLESWEASMLRGAAEAAALRVESGIHEPYCDPALLRNPLTYGSFLREMHQRGLVVFDVDDGADAALGIFFVRKKDG